jgi:predicted CoA-binding protein
MDHDNYPDSYVRGILNTVKTIAMVGICRRTTGRAISPSSLLERGYHMIPVNPGKPAATSGAEGYAARRHPLTRSTWSTSSGPRNTCRVAEALALVPQPQVIWMQLGIRNDAAAEDAGPQVMNRCPKIEYGRLSSRRPPA